MFQDNEAFARLPAELRQLRQWTVDAGLANATATDKQGKRPQTYNGITLHDASSTNPATWMDFASAANLAGIHGRNIGFMLHEDDPYTVIDQDVVDAESQAAKGMPIDPSLWTTAEEYEFFWSVAKEFNSYTEASRSGKGLHIFVRGKLHRAGVKQNKVEIYDRKRFIICTGKPVLDVPIVDGQKGLDSLVKYLTGGITSVIVELEDHPQIEEDKDIWDRATSAENGDKFVLLCRGGWQALGYPSQSEADLSLISMFCFYTKCNEQVRRMFRATVLGQRDKATKNNVAIDRSIRLTRQREKAEVVIDLNAIMQSHEDRADKVRQDAEARRVQAEYSHYLTPPPLTAAGTPMLPLRPAHEATLAVLAGPQPAAIAAAKKIPSSLDFPPGLIGKVAEFIYCNAARPIKEVAIVAALGMFAGMCGRAFFFSNSGLNLYILLVAQSSIGKEAMHSGLGVLCNHVPGLDQYVNFTDFASGPGLIKALAANPSFCQVSGEIGHDIRSMAIDEARAGPKSSLRKVMLNVYMKSGPNSYVGGMGYSKTEENVETVKSVAFSIIGESTPKTFYESLTERMMEDGFMSRFLTISYTGLRPPLNEDPFPAPPPMLVEALTALVGQASQLNEAGEPIQVQRTEDASDFLRDFELLTDTTVNEAGDDESVRQMWSRASMKVMRIASLLAVADNMYTPCITMEHVNWAHSVVRSDIAIMSKKLENGDIGVSDGAREQKLLSICKEFQVEKPAAGYKVPSLLHEACIIPRNYLQKKLQNASAFTTFRNGVNAALEDTIKVCISNGYLREVERAKLASDYAYNGRAYLIVSTP